MLRPVATRRPAAAAVAVRARRLRGRGPTDEQQIRDTLSSFERATAAHDYDALCDRILAPKLIDTLEQIGLPCEPRCRRASRDWRTRASRSASVKVSGDTATAEVRTSAAGQAPSQDTVELVRVGDGWRIASLGGTGAG